MNYLWLFDALRTGKSAFLGGEPSLLSSINGPCSIVMSNNQRVYIWAILSEAWWMELCIWWLGSKCSVSCLRSYGCISPYFLKDTLGSQGATKWVPPTTWWTIDTGWWFRTWLLFSIIYGMSSFPLTNSIIFQDGWNHQPGYSFCCFFNKFLCVSQGDVPNVEPLPRVFSRMEYPNT